jgi:ankyrin repeat protein
MVLTVVGAYLAVGCFLVMKVTSCHERAAELSRFTDLLINPPRKSLSDRNSWSPSRFFDDPKVVELCYAMERGDVPAVEKLLDDGVDINTRGKSGMTPLMWETFPLLNTELFEVMWKYRDRRVDGMTFSSSVSSEDYAAWKEESLDLLDEFEGDLKKWLELGADPTIPLSEMEVFPFTVAGIKAGSSVCDQAARHPTGNDYTKEFTVFPLLLDYIEDVDRPIPIFYGKTGQYEDPRITVMFYVVNGYQYNGLAPSPAIPENLALLIEAGADIEYKGPDEWTPLIAAAKGHNYNMVYMLLCAGANRQHESSDGDTLLSCLAESAEFYSGLYPELVKKQLVSLAEAEAQSENRDPEPDEWKTVSLERSGLSEVVYFLKVIEWLSEHEPSWRSQLDEMKSEVKAPYQEELGIDLDRVDYDPFAENWGNKYQDKFLPETASGVLVHPFSGKEVED